MRILLVEDDINLQTNLKAHLELAKYSVDVADDGEIGLVLKLRDLLFEIQLARCSRGNFTFNR